MIRLFAAAVVLGCIWDRDTIDDELRGVPDGLTLVTGRWHRHSAAYYKQRIAELPSRLASNPDDFEAYDDLAVAWERTGDRTRAIEVMARKREALDRKDSQEHRYRYHANLGTFLAHAGRYAEGRVEIEKALAINPAAHFGRERFQVDLIKYMIAVKERPALWSEHDALSHAGIGFKSTRGFSVVLPAHSGRSELLEMVPWTEAYTAIGGILRYGGTEGAELYRILGDLFVENGDLNLAWWSFQHAVEKKHPASELIQTTLARIEEHWKQAQYRFVPTLEVYRRVRAEADAWAASFGEIETDSVARGESPADPAVLRTLMTEADRRAPRKTRPPAPALPAAFGIGMAVGLSSIGLGLASGVWMTFRGRRRRQRTRTLRRIEQASRS
jgi:tetratricopeptide (TPR) repeat protein